MHSDDLPSLITVIISKGFISIDFNVDYKTMNSMGSFFVLFERFLFYLKC